MDYTLLQFNGVDFYLCCCYLSALSPVFFILAYYIYSKRVGKFPRIDDIFGGKKEKEEEVKVRREDIDYEQPSKTSRKKTSFIDKLLKRKKVCEDCGSELEYREAYDSWYCPECHTYK